MNRITSPEMPGMNDTILTYYYMYDIIQTRRHRYVRFCYPTTMRVMASIIYLFIYLFIYCWFSFSMVDECTKEKEYVDEKINPKEKTIILG